MEPHNDPHTLDITTLFKDVSEETDTHGIRRVIDPDTRRYVTIVDADLPKIMMLMPPQVISQYQKAYHRIRNLKARIEETPDDATIKARLTTAQRTMEKASQGLVNALLAARKNAGTLLAAISTDSHAVSTRTITLPKRHADKPLGYYYPEKGGAAWFKAHGRISVDLHQITPAHPNGTASEHLRQETDAHKDHPHTKFAVIRHGVFTYIVQAKKLNGRKMLFGKMIHDGEYDVKMTHWAKLTGWDTPALMRKAGIDPDQLA